MDENPFCRHANLAALLMKRLVGDIANAFASPFPKRDAGDWEITYM